MLRHFVSTTTLIIATVCFSFPTHAETIFDRLRDAAKENMKENAQPDRSADAPYIEEIVEKAIKQQRFSEPLKWRNDRTGIGGIVIVAPDSHRFELSKCFNYTRTKDAGGRFAGTVCKKPIGPWMITQEAVTSNQPTKVTAVRSEQVREAQSLLNGLGFQVGLADGILGSGTRKAIVNYQQASGLPVNGSVSGDLINRLRQQFSSAQKTSVIARAQRATSDSRTPDPIVLTIDGLEVSMLPGLKAIGGGFVADTRTDSYLKPMVDARWSYTSRIEHVGWSGDLTLTSEAVGNAKRLISALATIAERTDRPFVIVAHSWGSVLAYRSILELIQEGKLEKGAIDQLITMGSPLNAQDESKRLTSRHYDNWQGTMPLDGYVSGWRNYWMKADGISGSIPGLPKGKNIELTKLTKDAHGDFWGKEGDFTHIDRIGADLRKTLRKEGRVVGKWERIPAGESMEFLDDGTVAFVNGSKKMSGRYSFADESRLRVEFSGPGGAAASTVVSFELSDDELVITDHEGRTTKYRRKKPEVRDQIEVGSTSQTLDTNSPQSNLVSKPRSGTIQRVASKKELERKRIQQLHQQWAADARRKVSSRRDMSAMVIFLRSDPSSKLAYIKAGNYELLLLYGSTLFLFIVFRLSKSPRLLASAKIAGGLMIYFLLGLLIDFNQYADENLPYIERWLTAWDDIFVEE